MHGRAGQSMGAVRAVAVACVALTAVALTACSEPQYSEPSPDAAADLPRVDAASEAAVPDATGTGADAAARDAETPGDTGAIRDADAQRAIDPAGDGQVAPASPPTLEALPGKYGMIARFRARDNIGNWLYEDLIARAVIEDDGRADSLRMEWEICEIRTRVSLTAFPEIKSSILYPAKLQRREFRVVPTGDGFATFGEPLRFGFEELSQEQCPAGTTKRHPERRWLDGGVCNCPANAALPTRTDDCRVLDDDEDGQPATTVLFTVPRDNPAYTVSRDRNQLSDGVIAPNRKHAASYRTDSETFQLACGTPPCTRGSTSFCPAKANPVRFIPLEARPNGAEWTCADIMRDIDGLGMWGLESPVKPSGPDC